MNPTDGPEGEAKANPFSSLHDGQVAKFDFAITNDDMDAFARVSGDYNPLHSDAAFAVSNGFGGRVVYGALLLAKASRMVGMELPGRDSLWTGVDMQFVAPLLIGERATLEATVAQISPATRSVELRIRIHSGDRTIARGKVSVSVRDGG